MPVLEGIGQLKEGEGGGNLLFTNLYLLSRGSRHLAGLSSDSDGISTKHRFGID